MYENNKLIARIYGELEANGKYTTLEHSKNVSKKAIELCENPKLNKKIELACALHDISVIIPKEKWLETCLSHNIPIIKEEKEVPLLLHQKLSAYIAREKFRVDDRDVLSAVSCHTTLKTNASYLDLLLFISDKIAWDGQGAPPWIDAVKNGLTVSLQLAAYNYMTYMLENKLLLIMHSDFYMAYNQLKKTASV